MALSTPGLALAIQTAVLATPVGNGQTLANVTTASQQQYIYDSWYRIAEAIVNHIVANAVVTVPMTTHTHGGVTAGNSVTTIPIVANESGTVS